jgi:hypothetical protein
MNEFKTLAAADSLISHVTGEPLEIGRARSLTQYGRLEVCFDYRGKIGLFPIIAINGNSVPHAILFPVPEKTCYFVGVLKSKRPPLLDNKRLRITYASETNLETHHRFVADVLNPHAVLIAFTENIDPAMPDQPPAGFYWGRVLSEFKRDSQVIRPATIDKSEVSESNWRISSDEIRALFKNTDTPDALPKASDPAPIVEVVPPAPPMPAPIANWKMQIQAEATALCLRLRNSGANPTKNSILKSMTIWCVDAGVKTDGNIYPREGYLRTHVLGGKHWDVPN